MSRLSRTDASSCFARRDCRRPRKVATALSADYAENCTPGYYNNEGMPSGASRQNGFFFGGPTEFVEILEQWRATGTLPGLDCR